MAFGFGRHACPGRFFAATEIKMLIARLLLEYDIRMPEGVMERYKNIVRGDRSNRIIRRRLC
ncbi:ent-kaurene oxidase [Colletotrichum cuscutae]|nr:ent-kaurene oxidase [Colletotrichum cuscutae]